MNDLDVIREARDYLTGLIEKSDVLDPASWAVEAGPEGSAIVGFTKKPITWDDHGGEVFGDPTARLIVALRAAAPHIVGALDSWLDRIAGFRDAVEPIIETHDETFKAPTEALALARAILATKGHDDE